jgi:hypothetical protein
MEVDIGLAAGDVFRFLEANGPAAASQIKKGTGHKDALLNQAVGWLAREGKIRKQIDGKTVRWSL